MLSFGAAPLRATTPAFPAHVDKTGPGTAGGLRSIETLAEGVNVIDGAALGLVLSDKPLPVAPPNRAPLGNLVGARGAFMSCSRDLLPPSTALAVEYLSSGFLPGELVNYYFNGSYAAQFACDARGRISVFYTSGGGTGYFTLSAMGVTSGRFAGVANYQTPTAPSGPGLSVAPHAVAPGGSSVFYLYGDYFPPSTLASVRRNGTEIQTLTTSANGRFYIAVPVPAGPDAGAVYSVDTGTPGSLAAQSVEERADAGSSPQGDLNPSRFLLDRASLLSTSGGTVSAVGEGFQPGESVTLSGCSSGIVIADSDGGVGSFLTFGAASGVASCTYMGGTSGHVARAAVLLDANAVSSVPGLIVQSSHACGPGTSTALVARAAPNQMGTLYMDGVSAGMLTTDANGNASGGFSKPIVGMVHSVFWIGMAGDIVIGTLGVNVEPPVITTSPTDQNVCVGSMATFTAAATSHLGNQWQVSTDGGSTWTDVSGATADTYSFTPTLADNAHYYRSVYAGTCGSIPSGRALLQVNAPASITSNPTNAYLCASPVVTFTVGAAGGTLTYQWQVSDGLFYSNLLEGPPYSGVTSPTLTITNATTAMDGFVYRCVVDNNCSAPVASAGAVLNVDPTLPVVGAPAAAVVTQSTCN